MSGYANHDDVLAQLRSKGLLIDGVLEIASGKKSKRCLIEGGDQEKRGWYRLHEWQMEPGVIMLVGSFGIFSGSKSETFKVELTKKCANCGADVGLKEKKCTNCGEATFKKREFSDEQKAAFKARMEEDKRRAAAERAAEIERTSQWATAVWRACTEAVPSGHEYLVRKKLSGTGGARIFPGNDSILLEDAEPDDYRYLATFAGQLVIPLCDDNGRVFGLQFIAGKKNEKTGRDKTYWPSGMSVDGHYWLIGASPRRLCLEAEGFATGLSLHEATGQPVAVAFAANNLLPVAKAINARTKHRARLLLCADDDWLQKCRECKTYTTVEQPTCTHCGKPHGQINAGRARCYEVAMALDNAADFKPVFAVDRPTDRKGPTDFNDLACIEGLQVVTAQFEKRIEALKWNEAAATPHPVTVSPVPHSGGGEIKRRPAVSVMDLDDAVDRFVPLDDGTGDYVFDTWTNKVVKRAQMIALLPAGVRGDDIKRHHQWITRGAYYLDQVGFDPSGNDNDVKLNTWKGWPMKPASGSCERLLELLEYLCSGDPNGHAIYEWVLKWMAYPLQKPGAKMASAIIMHGPQGTGKSTVFQTLAKIYGDYATVLNQRGLEDKFNSDWSDSKLFILAEEVVTRAEMWHIKNELKELVTGEWIRINPKNIAAYRQRNQVNVAYLSNENQPLPLDNDDRRHLVIYTPPQLGEEYYDEVFLELENGGVAALYHYLLHLDLGDFHPKKRPPMTEAKKSLIALSAPSEIRFVSDWIAGDTGLPICPCLAADLYAAYLKWCRLNGETRPRPSNQFHGAVARLPGWDKKKCRIYPSPTANDTVGKPLVIPPNSVLADAGTAMAEGKSMARWLTDCVDTFSNAISCGQIGAERMAA